MWYKIIICEFVVMIINIGIYNVFGWMILLFLCKLRWCDKLGDMWNIWCVYMLKLIFLFFFICY